MTEPIKIRDSVPDDLASLESIYAQAFPDEDLLPLVKELTLDRCMVISLVGVSTKGVEGHAVFTRCRVGKGDACAALLGPLAVAAAQQRQGVGTALVQAGLQRLREAGVHTVFVLGDPAYYGRFGFLPERGVLPPYALPAQWIDAWQSLRLYPGASAQTGKLHVPRPWRRPELWAP